LRIAVINARSKKGDKKVSKNPQGEDAQKEGKSEPGHTLQALASVLNLDLASEAQWLEKAEEDPA
jgi:hypothetical protein